MIEQFQDQDWIGIPHEPFVSCVVVYFSDSFHKNIDFSGPLVLYMCKVSIGSVSKILSMLTQSLYVV